MHYLQSFQSGQEPQDWLDANVIPIYKKGHQSKPGNYRPVSLTSQVCKVMEFFILESISEHLKQHKLILDSQHGFRSKRSCLSNLLIFLEEVTSYIDKAKGYPVDVIYLDFISFDTVPHRTHLKTNRSWHYTQEQNIDRNLANRYKTKSVHKCCRVRLAKSDQ